MISRIKPDFIYFREFRPIRNFEIFFLFRIYNFEVFYLNFEIFEFRKIEKKISEFLFRDSKILNLFTNFEISKNFGRNFSRNFRNSLL